MSPNRPRNAVLLGLAIAVGGCDRTLDPSGEVVLEVDTDLPVPKRSGSLRVDVFAQNGSWLDAFDIARPDPSDWPVSFGLYSEEEVEERILLVRLRGYPYGKLRDYKGE